MFWHRSPQFNWPLSEPILDNPDGVVFNFTDAPAEANLINQAMARDHDVIGKQNDAEEFVKANPAGSSLPEPVKYNWGVAFAFEKSLMDRTNYEQWIRKHFYQFRRPEPWLEHMRRYRYSYGTRLHGNIAALLAGVRATWIVHDMRLKEVCDHFCLPTIEFEEVRAGVTLQALYDRADYSQCNRVYPDRYRALYEYVEAAALPHSLPTPVGGIGMPVTGAEGHPDAVVDLASGGGVLGASVPEVAVGR